MVEVTKNTKLPKGCKIPRKRKKWFKKNWIGLKTNVSLSLTNDVINFKSTSVKWVQSIFEVLWLKRYNQEKGFHIKKSYKFE